MSFALKVNIIFILKFVKSEIDLTKVNLSLLISSSINIEVLIKKRRGQRLSRNSKREQWNFLNLNVSTSISKLINLFITMFVSFVLI